MSVRDALILAAWSVFLFLAVVAGYWWLMWALLP